MLVRDVREHVLIVGISGKAIDPAFQVEKMPEEEIVIRSAWLETDQHNWRTSIRIRENRDVPSPCAYAEGIASSPGRVW